MTFTTVNLGIKHWPRMQKTPLGTKKTILNACSGGPFFMTDQRQQRAL